MKNELQLKLKDAIRNKDKDSSNAIRLLISAFQYEEMGKGVDSLPEAEYELILKRELKRRHEEKEFVEKADKPEDLEKLNKEIFLIESLLPKQLTDEALKGVVVQLIAENQGMQLGDVMKVLKEKYANQYDAKKASEIVRAQIA